MLVDHINQILGKPLFEMCCFHMGIAQKGCKCLPRWFEALFSHIQNGLFLVLGECLPGWFVQLTLAMSKKMYKKAHSARLAEVKSFLGNAHMETTHIKKGLS